MSKTEELKFFLTGWNLVALVIMMVALLFILAYSFNLPIGGEQQFNATIISVETTHDSAANASSSVATVEVVTGEQVDITLPKNSVVAVGDEIVVLKQRLFLNNSPYEFCHFPEKPSPG
jgi:PDZ domain-containing secreted protein